VGEVSTKAIMDTSKGVRRKVWSEELKREIVAAASAPGASVSVVARRYDVNTNLVFTWRRRYGKSQDVPPTQLLPMMVTPDQPFAASARSVFDGVEIDMPGGYRVRCCRGVNSRDLRLVLDALERR
jgi:transposase